MRKQATPMFGRFTLVHFRHGTDTSPPICLYWFEITPPARCAYFYWFGDPTAIFDGQPLVLGSPVRHRTAAWPRKMQHYFFLLPWSDTELLLLPPRGFLPPRVWRSPHFPAIMAPGLSMSMPATRISSAVISAMVSFPLSQTIMPALMALCGRFQKPSSKRLVWSP